MPDISMCVSDSCPKRNECYRVLAKPDKLWQSYSDFTLVCKEPHYPYFMGVEKCSQLEQK